MQIEFCFYSIVDKNKKQQCFHVTWNSYDWYEMLAHCVQHSIYRLLK